MGWSEQYWEDVKSELTRPAPEPEPTGDDDTPSKAPQPPRSDESAGVTPKAASGALAGERT